MKSEALKFFTDTHWTVFALLLFFAFFTILLFKIFSGQEGKNLEQKKTLIFNDGDAP